MKYYTLKSIKTQVSRIALGTWAFGDANTWGAQDDNDSVATVHAALDAGINFFNSAAQYGDGKSEQILGNALQGKRKDVVITTKVHATPMTKQMVKQSCEASLDRLKTDYIDLFQIHYMDRNVPLEETVAGLTELKKEGKIRAIGLCNAGIRDLTKLCQLEDIVVDELPYSLLWRAIEFEIKEKCIHEKIGILAYSPLASGLLSGQYRTADEVPEGIARTRLFSKKRPKTRHGEPGCEKEAFDAIDQIRKICCDLNCSMPELAQAWVLQQPGIAAVLSGARTPDEIRQNTKVLEMSVSQETLSMLDNTTQAVKSHIGKNPDVWQSNSRFE